jgi:hypothetical protein
MHNLSYTYHLFKETNRKRLFLDLQPPLWSRGQSSWLQIEESGFDSRLPDFLRSSGSGTGSTQPREYNWRATWKKKKSSGSGLENWDYGRKESVPLTTRRPSIYKKNCNNFADKRRSLGRYSSLTDSGHGVFLFFLHLLGLFSLLRNIQ